MKRLLSRTACVKVAGTKYYLNDAGYGNAPFAWINDFNNILNGKTFATRKAAMAYVGGKNNSWTEKNH